MVKISKNEEGGIGTLWLIHLSKPEQGNRCCKCCGKPIKADDQVLFCEHCDSSNNEPLFHRNCLFDYGGKYFFPCNHVLLRGNQTLEFLFGKVVYDG